MKVHDWHVEARHALGSDRTGGPFSSIQGKLTTKGWTLLPCPHPSSPHRGSVETRPTQTEESDLIAALSQRLQCKGTTAITTELASDNPTKNNNPSAANFFQYFLQKLNAMRDNIERDPVLHHVSVGSWMYTNGGRRWRPCRTPHLSTHPRAHPSCPQRSTLTIHTGAS